MRHGPLSRLLAALTFVTGLAVSMPALAQSPPAADEYTQRIKPIFESRCIACHSCYNAPCQLNLQSYSGAARGATPSNVYDATRRRSVPPTRVDIDATTPAAWREKGFNDVLGEGDPARSLLLQVTKLRARHASLQPDKQVAESQVCVVDGDDSRLKEKENRAALAMPYGLPPLASSEIAALQAWLEHGAPAPASLGKTGHDAVPEPLRGQVVAWETFLNEPSARQRLVSRYLYEHLFLGSLHFAGSLKGGERPPFFRLVRSRTACSTGIDEIATRRPTDAPDSPQMFYCLRPITGAIVEKTHIPYELSPQKLERLRTLFLGKDWTLPGSATESYSEETAANPFETFAAIPVRARYQFLLDDAHYHVATFIKGPVCNGSSAVNSIQEQFYVFFLKPEADSMVMSPEHAEAAQSRLMLPGERGSDITLLQDIPFYTRVIEHREQYRKLRAESVAKLRPNGYALDDIWDGDGTNPNALLTVFRHDDSAAVFKGAVGDLPKTVFVLDYPLFERLVYNLVVNFDVFGNVGHQIMTRGYMDLIRMEAEELFLSFLPPPDRKALRSDWYKGGLLTDVKLNLVFPLTGLDHPTAVQFKGKSSHKLELVQRLLSERLPERVRGPTDPINWRNLQAPGGASGATPTPADKALRRIASVYAERSTPFARYFPEMAILLVRKADGSGRIYSIVHNRELANVSWIMGESLRRLPAQDTLTIAEGVRGSYPNMLFTVDEAQLPAFTRAAASITSGAGYEKLVDKYGVRRTSQRFWKVYDEINAIAVRDNPVERGTLDLTRYALESR